MMVQKTAIERRAVKLGRCQTLQRAMEGRGTPAEMPVRTSTMGAIVGRAVVCAG